MPSAYRSYLRKWLPGSRHGRDGWLLIDGDDGAFLNQFSALLAIDGKGRHAIVDRAGDDRLGQEIARRRSAGNAVAPARTDPQVVAIRMRPQQRREIGCGMNVAGPLPQNPEVGQR